MTADEIALVKQLRTRARVYEMVGDTTPSVLMSRAANAMESIGPTERARIVAALRVHAQRLDDAQESDPHEVHGVIKVAQLLEDNVL